MRYLDDFPHFNSVHKIAVPFNGMLLILTGRWRYEQTQALYKKQQSSWPYTIIDVSNNSLFLCCFYAIHLCTCLPLWTFPSVFIPRVRREVLDTAKSLWHLKHVVLIIMQGYTVMVQLDFGAYQLLLHYKAIQPFKGSYHTTKKVIFNRKKQNWHLWLPE